VRVFLVLTLLVVAQRAAAQGGPWCQHWQAQPRPDSAEVVFVGRVLGFEPLPGSSSKLEQTFSEYWVTTTLAERVWKVPLPDTVRVLTQLIGSSFEELRPQSRIGGQLLFLAQSAVDSKHLADLPLAKRDTVWASYCTGWLQLSALESLRVSLGPTINPAP
jgi:hypothetical protein